MIHHALIPEGTRAQEALDGMASVGAVRALNVGQTPKQMRVRLRGVVTFFNETLYSRFIQDETAGIYLLASTNTPPLVVGQRVELEGVINPGEFAPVVLPQRVRVVGTAALPEPRRVTYEQLATGSEDSQFVEVVGMVRTVQYQAASKYYLIKLATGSGRLSVYAPRLPVAREEGLPDSLVRVRGVCSTEFNHRRQLFAIRLLVPRADDLSIESPAPLDPFAIPVHPIGSLLQFAPQQSSGRRVKTEGSVIYFEPGKKLYLQNEDQGLEVQLSGGEALALGDRVEATGFVGQGDYTPVLQDAIYRKVSPGRPLTPELVTPEAALKGKHDSQLIAVNAQLLDRGIYGSERYLILQAGNCIFQAYLGRADEADPLGEIRNGSRVDVAGVCQVEPGAWLAGENWRAKSFRLQMRSVADVRLLEAPSWWTLRRVLWVVGALVLAMVAALGWVVVLQRQVELQLQKNRLAERQREVEQERTRVAQDLHDELGSALTEVSMLGSLARTPTLPSADRDRFLEQLTGAAREMVGMVDEIVWAVNPKYDSVSSLASYYSLFAQRLLNLAGMACRLQVAETFPDAPLDSRRRHEVFLVFKEALNNAVRHSKASQVRIEMAVWDQQLRIVIADDGCGFDPVRLPPGSDGLANMQARMSQLGGCCSVRSQPQKGTAIEICMPLRGMSHDKSGHS